VLGATTQETPTPGMPPRLECEQLESERGAAASPQSALMHVMNTGGGRADAGLRNTLLRRTFALPAST
jgi:hypothetical protein